MNLTFLTSDAIYLPIILGTWAIFCIYKFSNIPTIKLWEVNVLTLVASFPFYFLPYVYRRDVLWVIVVIGIIVVSKIMQRNSANIAGTVGRAGYLRLVHFTRTTTKVVRNKNDLKNVDVLILSKHQLEQLSKRSSKQHNYLVELVNQAIQQNISVLSLLDFLEQKYGYIDIHEETMINPSDLRSSKTYRFAKRITDSVLAIILAILSLPITLVTAIAILTVDHWPIFYTQERIGKSKRHFDVIKFRTMISHPNNTVTSTSLGKVLRILHIDELPQLINVLRGEMALVGPRPEWVLLTSEKSAPKNYWLRQAVRPGLTGWAQVNYHPSRNKTMRRRKLGYDLFYIKNRSFFIDSLIYLRTVRKLSTFWKTPLE